MAAGGALRQRGVMTQQPQEQQDGQDDQRGGGQTGARLRPSTATDRVVVVTGAAGGIGSRLVERFLADGDTVVATDTTADGLAALADRLDAGERLVTTPADITSEEDVSLLAGAAGAVRGRVDVVVNCAGWFPFRTVEEMGVQEWRQVVDVNLTGVFLVTRALLLLMRDGGWGRIVNISSASVFTGPAGQAHYVAAKAGVIGLTRVLAHEVGRYGTTVNAVAPGVTLTGPVRASFPPEMLARQVASRALPREQRADDLVGAVRFLASPDADFVSGQALTVDGGNVVR